MHVLTLCNARWKHTLIAVHTPHFMATLHIPPSTPLAWLQDVSKLITLDTSAMVHLRKRQDTFVLMRGRRTSNQSSGVLYQASRGQCVSGSEAIFLQKQHFYCMIWQDGHGKGLLDIVSFCSGICLGNV